MTSPTHDAPIQLLDPAGSWAPSPDAEPFLLAVEELTDDTLLHFYREMLLTRRLDEASTVLQRQGQLSLWTPSFGQEAAQTGSGHALAPQDTVFPSCREHGVALARGIDFVDILAVLRGTTFRGWSPEATRFRLYTVVLGAQTVHAVGNAMGISLDRYRDAETTPEAVIVYVGDGAMSEGDSSEALVFARSFDAPVVFFVQNNGWAISTPTTVQTTVPYARRADGFDIAGHRVDGNDVLASYAVTKTIMDNTRAGAGRALIEAVTYRRGPHTSSDDPTKYRSKNEEEHWAQLDPIAQFAAHLRHLDVGDDLFAEAEKETGDLVAEVPRRLIALPAPESAIMFDHVYTDPHPATREQRDWLSSCLATSNEDRL